MSRMLAQTVYLLGCLATWLTLVLLCKSALCPHTVTCGAAAVTAQGYKVVR